MEILGYFAGLLLSFRAGWVEKHPKYYKTG
jgi:hypothetical protein